MHELSIASSVVDRVLEFLDSHEVKKVITVRLAIGELSNVEAEQLRFCYTAITQETALENSTLEIENVPAVVECPSCSYVRLRVRTNSGVKVPIGQNTGCP